MKSNTKVAASAVALGLLAAVVTLLIKPPATWDYSNASFHFSLSGNALTFLLHMGAATLFLMSLGVYKEKLQKAYIAIVLGVVLIAIGTFQLPVLDALDKWNSAYVTHGFIGLPFLVGSLVLYFGAVAFGRLVGEKSVFTKPYIILPATLLLASVAIVLPHVATTVDEASYDTGNVVLSWITLLLLSTSLLFFRIRSDIGAHYKYAMLWTAIGVFGSMSCVFVGVLDTFISTATRDNLTAVLNILTILAGFAWLKAGYAFTVTKEY